MVSNFHLDPLLLISRDLGVPIRRLTYVKCRCKTVLTVQFIDTYCVSSTLFFVPLQSVRKKYGAVYSMKVGSFKVVFAEDADCVKEVLVKKSADYAGRPPFHSLLLYSLGTVSLFTLHCILQFLRSRKAGFPEISY